MLNSFLTSLYMNQNCEWNSIFENPRSGLTLHNEKSGTDNRTAGNLNTNNSIKKIEF